MFVLWRVLRGLPAIALVVCSTAAGGFAGGCGEADERASVVVFCAASAADCVEQLAREHPELRIVVSSGSSSALGAQILQGAPADIFLCANVAWMDTVAESGLVERSQPLLANRLALVTPRGNPSGVGSPADLEALGPRRVALAGAEVPAGRYAGQALEALGLLKDLEQGGRIVRASDVRSALVWADRGEVDAAIVYATDARVGAVDVVWTFDASLHEPIVYPVALLNRNGRPSQAERVYELLCSPEGERIFGEAGFAIPERP